MKPLPGKPQAQLQAVTTALWDGRRIIVYIAGNALIILGGPNDLIQTINHDEDEQLTTVAIHDVTGKIATATKTSLFIYRPFGHDFGAPRWSREHTFTPSSSEDAIYTLSWGLTEELLVGGTSLTLFSAKEDGGQVWTRNVANPVKFAALSPDGGFIATTGWHDRLVKIWRRLYLSEKNERFDVSYLPHPAAVTELRWHGRRDPEYHAEAILYTTSIDNKLRVWAATDTHGLQALQLWAELDLIDCMLPEVQPTSAESDKRYVFIIDNWEYEALVERVTHRSSNTEKDQETLKRLVDVAYRDPDICVVLDDKGNMSAWGLERVGCKARHANDVFKIAQVKGVDMHCMKDADAYEDYATCLSFGGLGDGCEVNLLIHFFDGRIQWLTCPIDRLFYQEPEIGSFITEALWTGHTEVIEEVVSSQDGRHALSRSLGNEIVLWKQEQNRISGGLERVSSISNQNKAYMARVLDGGQVAITVDEHHLSLWDARSSKAVHMSSQGLPAGFNVTDCVVSTSDVDELFYSILLVTDALQGMLYQVSMGKDKAPESLLEMCEVTPVHCDQPTIFNLVHSAQNVPNFSAVSITPSGLVIRWALEPGSLETPIAWSHVGSIDTGIKEIGDAKTSHNSKLAVLDSKRTRLTIWDLLHGSLELNELLDAHDTIEHLSWTYTTDGNSVLAVVFTHKVSTYVQMPYELSESGSRDAWIRLRETSINEVTNLPISDCVWLSGGDLLLSAGNQMFLFDKEIDGRTAYDLGLPTKSQKGQELFKVVSAMNFTLPLFHPQLLRQCLIGGKYDLVHKILRTLHRFLRYYTEGDKLDSFLSLDLLGDVVNLRAPPPGHKSRDHVDHADEDASHVTAEIAEQLEDQLTHTRLPHLPTAQRDELIRIIQSFGTSRRHQKSLDSYGFQHLTLAKDYFLHPDRAEKSSDRLPSREIVSAYHTTNQDILVDTTSRQYQGRMLWKDARECGICLWMTDITALRTQFETIARNEYTKGDDRNPVDCSLYYIALRKKAVLIGLWRMAAGNKEQGATQRLLANNFTDPKWQTTALKNAYALLGRRRFQYAAAFFLLADRLHDAVNILVTSLNDMQLAVAVARVYEGDDGPVLKSLLEDRVLPLAAQEGDRWLAHWAFDMLGRRDLAMKCLVAPLPSIINVKLNTTQIYKASHFRKADPGLLFLYSRLRDMVVPPGQDPYLAISPKDEWAFVMQTVRTYIRAGCAALALDLVQSWRFLPPSLPQAIKRRTSKVQATTQQRSSPPSELDAFFPSDQQVKSSSTSQPPSLLDSFTTPTPTRATPKQQASMLDSFMDPQPVKATPKQPASMLDAFMDPQPSRPAKAQPQQSPTQAKAPEPSNYPSMLDAFNYPSPPFTRTGTPSITRAGTPAPMSTAAKVGKSSLALNMMMSSNDGEGEDQKDESVNENGKVDAGTNGVSEGVGEIKDDVVKRTGQEVEEDKIDGRDNGDDEKQHDDERIAGFGGAGAGGGGKKPRKKVMAEPSAASILDDFDF